MMSGHPRPVELAVVIALCLALGATAGARERKRPAPKPKKPAAAVKLECGDLVGFEVLLDRQGFSPGQIDGKSGKNLSRALAALQSQKKLPATGQPDCATWQALGGGGPEATLTTYTITAADLKGPFEKLPPRLAEQANLPALGYQSPIEEIGERFHAAPALLTQLNPGIAFTEGHEIRVPAVTPFDPDARPAKDVADGDLTIHVSRAESALRATRADGSLVFFAPVSSGSVHDPLPPGDWKVRGVGWHPTFHYNPKLFWDAKPKDTKATLKAGPNNPVGVVWIDLNIEHYGIHGTPEPGNVGRTESHGCVRLTNWDAARVAALVKPGTVVLFR